MTRRNTTMAAPTPLSQQGNAAQPGFCTACGAPLTAPPVEGLCPGCLLRAGLERPAEAAQLESLLPAYEIHELIGRGGMGTVHRARQRSLDREVAIKLLSPDLASTPGFAERFEREARALAKLNHPHIVTVHDFGCVQGHFFLVMEYVTGVSLRQLLQQRQLSQAEALALVPQLCEALQYAHEHGVVHRDIKPENILLDARGRVKIADFGLAKLTSLDAGSASPATLTAPRQVMGTPRYMAPEQVDGSPTIDHRADIYSLGLVFYEMLTGELPMGRFDPPSEMVEVDVRLDEVVLKALARRPERRYQQASEVRTAVEQFEHLEPPVAARRDTEAESAARPGATVAAVGGVPAAVAGAPAEAATAEENGGEDAEGFLWAILCLIIPTMAYLGVVWSDTWLPLALLFFTGAGIGSFFPKKDLNGQEFTFMLLALSLAVSHIGVSMAHLESAQPLFALILLVGGMAYGSEEEKKRLADKEAEAGDATQEA